MVVRRHQVHTMNTNDPWVQEREHAPSYVYNEGTSNGQHHLLRLQDKAGSLQRASWCGYSLRQVADCTLSFRRPDVQLCLSLQLWIMTLISIERL